MIIFTIILHSVGLLKPIESFLRVALNYSSKITYHWTLETRGRPEVFSSPAELQEAYETLSVQCLDYQKSAAEAVLLADENKALREQLRFFARAKLYQIGADVIGKNLEPAGNTLILNRGLSDGLFKGQPVIAGEGILIGKIVQVEDGTAMVQLINDGQSKVAATLLNHERSLGIVEGGHGLSVRMGFIPQNEAVAIGDMVVTSGLESGMPRGLLIGVVEAVEKEAYEPFQKAVITPLVSLSGLTVVSVITTTTPTLDHV